MKLYKFKEEQPKDEKRPSNLNKRKYIIRISIILSLIITAIVLIFLYTRQEEFREWMDVNIFKKQITNEDIVSIELDSGDAPYIYAYDKYVVTLEKNNLKGYNYTGKQELDIEVSISKPIFSSNNKYLAIAEAYGKRLYLITSQGILWENQIEGEISRINVNKNGYVTIAITQTGYKTKIMTYSPKGAELFTTFLSTTYGVDMDMSDDNKYLAIAEIDSTRNSYT